MQKQKASKSLNCFSGSFQAVLCALVLVSTLTVTILGWYTSYPRFMFSTTSSTATSVNISHVQIVLPRSIHIQISSLQHHVGLLLEQLHVETENSESKALAKFSDQVLRIAMSLDKLSDSLYGSNDGSAPLGGNEASNVDEDFSEPEEESDVEEGWMMHQKIFKSGELHNYTSPKSNRLGGKKNFLGVEAVNPSIGLPCARMASDVDRFMSYRIYGVCPDDWDTAQKLILGGCDPLPRRRCFSKTPPRYTNPFPVNSSLWSVPSNTNILWSHYKCKDYSSCLH